MNFVLVALGGFFGSITRFSISKIMNKRIIGTWIANTSGSVLLAVTFHYYTTGAINQALWLCLGVGFCGSYTTFSTFGNETLQLLLKKKFRLAILYVLSSIIIASFLFIGTLFVLTNN